jgi:hypothetical protein
VRILAAPHFGVLNHKLFLLYWTSVSAGKLISNRICPHRGKGDENTLKAITAGIADMPFMVEFDVQWIDDDLYLGHPYVKGSESGHPEEMFKKETLSQALQLFTASTVMPKVDLKLNAESLHESVDALREALSTSKLEKILVNISGVLELCDISSHDYMRAEQQLLSSTSDNVLLNIDLNRYAGITKGEIITDYDIYDHIASLTRKPFGLSPNIGDDIDAALAFAVEHSIPQVHFWSNRDVGYDIDDLFNIFAKTEAKGLTCYFSIFVEKLPGPELALV